MPLPGPAAIALSFPQSAPAVGYERLIQSVEVRLYNSVAFGCRLVTIGCMVQYLR